jgi:uncharacterized protein YqeY
MRAKDSARLQTIRLILAAIKQKEVDSRVEADDAEVVRVLDKMVKQRKDSIEQFTKAGRTDLVAQEEAETVVISAYLPQRMGADEVERTVRDIIAQVGAASLADIGKVMGAAKKSLDGKADMAVLSATVKRLLSS